MTGIGALLEQWKSRDPGSADSHAMATFILDESERSFREGKNEETSRNTWFDFLDLTRKPDFLGMLGTSENRNRWTEVVFGILRETNYTLRDMIVQRVAEHPARILFRELSESNPVEWTYEQIYRHIREIATVFYQASPEPRVAIFSENCLEGACTDLACLTHEIFVTPLSTHFTQDILLSLFDQLKISIAVADSKERLALLQKLREKTHARFAIFSLVKDHQDNNGTSYLLEECKKPTKGEIESVLSLHSGQSTSRVATTMFTSGSTGLPKGVSFSMYNIISKRFARAGALPKVGDETFLCYLPLFHTFGRYLEMTGSIFWSGTYVFAGNSSAETLFARFPEINPTGFISIPLRWQELYEKCQEKISGIESADLREKAVREVVGRRLGWGLSAAGYLDPAVFRFFNQYRIALCSGFGMTEATGGITMTPPGQYRENSVGIPLPGVFTRLNANSELEISGHYIGRYLEDAGPGDVIPYPIPGENETWLKTGDVFRVSRDGHYQIVDRVKDIYKNNRGQTVAPQVIEKKFYKVPGIKNTFLVGDNRPYNVLLIAPDKHDPIYSSITGDNLNEYYHRIVSAANADVAPYERVVNFSLIDRDFSQETGELTPKGSFNRKAIEKNFSGVIESLYVSNVITIDTGSFTIIIPRWFFRDLGILETDLSYEDGRLVERTGKKALTFRKLNGTCYLIGDFRYKIKSDAIDIGIFARQPRLWVGNPELIAFCPVKEGWDAPLKPVSEHIYLDFTRKYSPDQMPVLRSVRDQNLARANELIIQSLFSEPADSFKATEGIGRLLDGVEPRMVKVLRTRMEALAFHPDEKIRTLAYRILLLKAPDPDEVQYLPSFIESGLPFLNEKSIREIASSNFGKHRLDALKRRLYWYRTHLKWPAEQRNQQQFETVLRMLYNFAVLHLEFYVSVRAELSRWILHKSDPYLSKKAEEYFNKLAVVFELHMKEIQPKYPVAVWKSKISYEYGISAAEKERITGIFSSTAFLQESIILAFNETGFDLREVPDNGIWVLRLQAFKEFRHYRLSINTRAGRHYDLHMVMSENPDFRPKTETFYWMASLATFPYGPAVAPLLGSNRPTLGVMTSQYIGGLTAWDKIREFSEIHRSAGVVKPNAWKKLFIRAFAVIYKAWHHSGYQIVPGGISPSNVVVPEMDWRESAIILSLTGWSEYVNTRSLTGPMLQDFYCKTAAIYPWCKKQLDVRWIFDACIEGLGKEEARNFLDKLQSDQSENTLYFFDNGNLLEELVNYLHAGSVDSYLPLSLYSAIDQYIEWYRMNPLTTSDAKQQTLSELMELYKLQEFPELIRYYFYRYSYFSDAAEEVTRAFDELLARMQAEPHVLPIQLLELSELQSVISGKEDKNVFSRMVFPRLLGEQKIDIQKVGESLQEHVVVRFDILDKSGTRYIQREPLEPREIGQLYQLYFRENYPKEIADADNHFVVVDESNRMIGGLTWRYLDESNVLLDGIVVMSSLQGKGIASAMIENFFTSMAARGVKVIKAHFLLGNYYMKHYFTVDRKWGALVKVLGDGQ
jgi:long-chain acyl-CoA synthetase